MMKLKKLRARADEVRQKVVRPCQDRGDLLGSLQNAQLFAADIMIHAKSIVFQIAASNCNFDNAILQGVIVRPSI